MQAMSPNTCQNCPSLEVAKKKTVQAGKDIWETAELPLDSFLRQNDNDSIITVIYAQADKVRECPRCQQGFTDTFKIPETWWSRWCRRSNGYFGCEDTTDEQGKFDGHNTWFRFLIKQTFEKAPEGQKDYIWYKLNVFTRWNPSTNQIIVLVFDPRPAIKERLPSPLLDSSIASDFSYPYWIHALFVEEVVRLQDEAVWAIRNLVRNIEVHRTTSTAPNPNYPRLHDIARHAIHISETLDLAVKTVECMIAQHDQFIADRGPSENSLEITKRKFHKRMNFYQHMLSSLQSRSTSNKERLLNEIQLAFNTVAQYDSHISLEIGRAAQVDSAAMKTIAFLTMTFFPATFISAIFSMSFFSYNPDTDQWFVSKMFWLYWVVAIPVTCITALLWLFWHKFFPPKRIGGENFQPRDAFPAKGEVQMMTKKLRTNIKDAYIKERV